MSLSHENTYSEEGEDDDHDIDVNSTSKVKQDNLVNTDSEEGEDDDHDNEASSSSNGKQLNKKTKHCVAMLVSRNFACCL